MPLAFCTLHLVASAYLQNIVATKGFTIVNNSLLKVIFVTNYSLMVVMKKTYLLLFVAFFAVTCKLQAQAIVVEQEFDSGTTPPTGWSFTSIGGTGTSVSQFGKSSPSLQMDATGDRITSAAITAGTANTINFWARSTSSTPGAGDLFTVQYSNDGGTNWTNCSPATFTFNTTARMFEATFPSTANRVRVTFTRSSANAYIDDFTLLNKTITCTTTSFLWFTSIIYNSCAAAGNNFEGLDEVVTFQNGATDLSVADLEINLPQVAGTGLGTTICGNTTTPCNSFFITNSSTAAYIASLNSASGCSGFFLAPPSGTIPANGRVMIFMGVPSTPATYSFSTLCASGGNYYCVFVNNSNTGPRYGNSSTDPRYTSLRNRSTGCLVERSFIASSGSGADGDIAAFNPTSTAVSYTTYASCAGYAVLPITLTDFYAKPNQNSVQLNWHIETELNVDHYIIERSNDGLNFAPVSTIKSSAETNGYANLNYSSIDYTPKNGINYYRLVNVDKDGSVNYNKTILVNFNQTYSADVWVNQTETDIVVSHKTSFANKTFYLMDISGKKIGEYKNLNNGLNYFTINKLYLPKGLYVIGCIDGNMPPQKLLIN